MNKSDSSENLNQRDPGTSDESLSNLNSRQSPTTAVVITTSFPQTTHSRDSVPQTAQSPMFKPPLRRHSTSTPLSKLHAAFKSPLRTSITPEVSSRSASKCVQHRSDIATSSQAQKAPRLKSQLTAKSRPTPYPCTPTRTHFSRGSRVAESTKDTQETPDSIAADIAQLREQLESAESEIVELSRDYCEDELQQYIDHLHEYNEIKDVGQLLLGKLAEVKGTTTAELYQHFELNLDD